MRTSPVALGWCALLCLAPWAPGLMLPVAEDTASSVSGVLSRSSGLYGYLVVAHNQMAYLRFEVGSLAGQLTPTEVKSARLTLYLPVVAKADDLSLHEVTGEWTEAVAANVPVPPINRTPFATLPAASIVARQFAIVDITAQVKAWLAQPASDHGLMISCLQGAVAIASKEGAATGYPATLEIDTVSQSASDGDASLLTTGTIPDARFPATLPAVSGANLTALNPEHLSSAVSLAKGGTGGTTATEARGALAVEEPRVGFAHLISAITSNHYPLRVAVTGDSMIENKRYALLGALSASFGAAGYTMGGMSVAVSGGAVLNHTDFQAWPNGYSVTMPTGGSTEFALDGIHPIMGDTLKVYYVQEPGAGSFKVQTSLNGADFADEAGFTAVSTNGAKAGRIITITKATAGLFKMRVAGVSGTVRVLGAGVYRANYPGLLFMDIAQPGIDLVDMVKTDAAIAQPILQDLRPDIYFYEMRDDRTALQSYLANYRGFLGGSADWVMIGSAPYSSAAEPTIPQAATNAWLRSYAQSLGLTYWDDASLFLNGDQAQSDGLLAGDGVHLTSAGINLAVSYMFSSLGLWHLSYLQATTSGGSLKGGTLFRSDETNNLLRLSTPPGNYYTGLQAVHDENNYDIGMLAWTSDQDAALPSGFLFQLGSIPQLKVDRAGHWAFGVNTPAASQAAFEFQAYGDVMLLRADRTPASGDFLRMQTSDGAVVGKVDANGKATMKRLRLSDIPTSAAGLSSGDIWSNGGVLNVVP